MDFTAYTTTEGDTWSGIAYIAYGDYTKTYDIIKANPGVPITARLEGGLTLNIPILTEDNNIQIILPPWRQ